MIRLVAAPLLLLFVSACITVPSAPEPPTSRRNPLRPLERPDPALVEELDGGVQARFRNLRPEDIENRDFGASRYASLGMRHQHGVVREDLTEERGTLDRISAAGWTPAVWVVEARRDGIGAVVGPIVAHQKEWPTFDNPGDIAGVAARAIATNASVRDEGPGMTLEARPVIASKTMCLRCHRKRTLGGPLGAVVYAFKSAGLAEILSRAKTLN